MVDVKSAAGSVTVGRPTNGASPTLGGEHFVVLLDGHLVGGFEMPATGECRPGFRVVLPPLLHLGGPSRQFAGSLSELRHGPTGLEIRIQAAAVIAELPPLGELQPTADAVVRLEDAELLQALAMHPAELALLVGCGMTPVRATNKVWHSGTPRNEVERRGAGVIAAPPAPRQNVGVAN